MNQILQIGDYMRIDIKSQLDSVWHVNKLSVLQGEVGYRLAHELLEDFEVTDKVTHAIAYADLWMEASAAMVRQFESFFDSLEAALGRPPTKKEIEKYTSLIFLIQHQQLITRLLDSQNPS